MQIVKIGKLIQKLKLKMKLTKKRAIVLIITLFLAVSIGYISKYWLGADNFIEQMSEKVIEENTGLQIDLSPQFLD